MKSVNVKLNLNKHCIETEIKRLHNRAILQCFESDMTKQEELEIENRIELLQLALKTFDFGFLRSTCVTLAGNSNDDVILSSENNQPVIRINGIKYDQSTISDAGKKKF